MNKISISFHHVMSGLCSETSQSIPQHSESSPTFLPWVAKFGRRWLLLTTLPITEAEAPQATTHALSDWCFPLRDSHGSHSHFPSVSVKCYLSKNLPCPPCQTSSPTYLHTHTHTLPHHCFVSSLHPSHITYLLITVCLLIVPGTQQISVISAE